MTLAVERKRTQKPNHIGEGERRRVRSPKVSAENPLVAQVYAPTWVDQAAASPWLAAWVEWVVRFVPTYRVTRTGRRGKRTVQLLLGLVALGIAIAGKTWAFAICGALVAGLAMVLPVTRSRRAVWIDRLQKKQRPTPTLVWAHGELVWDGVKITVRHQGRVLRSVRPAETGYRPVRSDRVGVFELERVGGNTKDRWSFFVVDEQHWRDPGVRSRLLDQPEGIGMHEEDWNRLVASMVG